MPALDYFTHVLVEDIQGFVSMNRVYGIIV